MTRYLFGALAVVLFLAPAAPAQAYKLNHRFWIQNRTHYCLSATAQMKGPYHAQALPTANKGGAINHLLFFEGSTQEWFIEYTLHECDGPNRLGKLVYRGWYIDQTYESGSSLIVQPKGSGFEMTGH